MTLMINVAASKSGAKDGPGTGFMTAELRTLAHASLQSGGTVKGI